MAGYGVPKEGIEWLKERLTGIERQVNELRSSAGILSAIIGKGGIRVKDGGSIAIQDGGGILVTEDGFITTIGGTIRAVHETTGAALAYFGKLIGGSYKSGLLTSDDDGDPFFWAAQMVDDTKVLHFGGEKARVDATDNIILNTPSLRLYGLPTTGAAANVRLETSTGTPVLQFVTSSRRYKTDIVDADIDPADVLKLRPRVWRDKGEVERDGDNARLNIGFIAEEVNDLESLRLAVDYNADGEPDALQYERIPTGLVVLAQHQQERIEALEATVANLSERLAATENLGA